MCSDKIESIIEEGITTEVMQEWSQAVCAVKFVAELEKMAEKDDALVVESRAHLGNS